MKRLRRIISSDSDDDAIDKNKIKKRDNSSIKETTKTIDKQKKRPKADDSDDNEIDIGKIKDKYNVSNKEPKKEKEKDSGKGKKRLTIDDKQMSIEAAFSKSNTKKRKVENSLDSWIKKEGPKPTKTEITPDDFFSKSKPKTAAKINSEKETPSKSGIKDATESEVIIKSIVDEEKSAPVAKSYNLSSPSKISIKDTKRIPKVENKVPTVSTSTLPSPSKSDNKKTSKIIPEVKKVIEQTVSPLKTPTKTLKKDIEDLQSPASAKKKASYAQYMHREGPKALGTKDIPQGSPNCLSGKIFVITGVLDSIERDDAQALIERCGGKVTKAISGKTTYLVVGELPGDSKVEKAKKMKTNIINEDELFELIRKASPKDIKPSAPVSTKSVPVAAKSVPVPTKSMPVPTKSMPVPTKSMPVPAKAGHAPSKKEALSGRPVVARATHPTSSNSILLSEKYRPTCLAEVIGQHGDRSPANKLLAWLTKFDRNLKSGGSSSEEGSQFRAALLSGPPGIGKTTTATLVCRQLGYVVLEMNASSVRSKGALQANVKESLTASSFHGCQGAKHCVIMDEVDGMAGNEDRGGIQELIQLIKTTRHPIICICNDRQARKLQSLARYVYDLRFRQPPAEAVQTAAMSIVAREGLSLGEEEVRAAVRAAGGDVRQLLNHLHVWGAGGEGEGASGKDRAKMGPFEVVPRVFSHEGAPTWALRSDLFFEDYQLGPLFVQENYVNVRPLKAKGDPAITMRLLSLAADSIALGDIVSSRLRASNNWSLLPTMAIFSSVLPGEYLHGRLSGRIDFPSWLGRFSRANKNARILSSISSHLALSSRGGACQAVAVATDYGEALARRLVLPLKAGNVEGVLTGLNEAQLCKEDFDLLLEATAWKHLPSPLATVSTATKSALTRAYNKAHFTLPYATVDFKKTLRGAAAASEAIDGEEEDENQEDAEEEETADNDVMIVMKTPTAGAKKAAPKKPAAEKKTRQKAVKK